MSNNTLYNNEFIEIFMIKPDYPFMRMKKPGVVIVPYDSRGNIYMIHKHRDGIGKFYELPMGFVESAENYMVGAIRELFEETGLKAERMNKLGKVQKDTSRIYADIEVVAVEVKKSENKIHTDKADKETNLVVGLSKMNIHKLIVNNNIVCGMTLSALNKYWSCRKLGLIKNKR